MTTPLSGSLIIHTNGDAFFQTQPECAPTPVVGSNPFASATSFPGTTWTKKIKSAIELSEQKYCSVYATLRAVVVLVSEFEIVNEQDRCT
jgi:hypothetical protein